MCLEHLNWCCNCFSNNSSHIQRIQSTPEENILPFKEDRTNLAMLWNVVRSETHPRKNDHDQFHLQSHNNPKAGTYPAASVLFHWESLMPEYQTGASLQNWAMCCVPFRESSSLSHYTLQRQVTVQCQYPFTTIQPLLQHQHRLQKPWLDCIV